MFPVLQQRWQERNEFHFDLAALDDFPVSKYQELMTIYQEAEAWFTGQKLEETNRDNAELYPLRVNPLVGTCLKHASVLFGEPQDDGRPQVYPKLMPQNDAEKELAEQAEDALNQVWYQSGGRALLIEGGILSQIYGGTVLKATFDGTKKNPNRPYNQFKVESISPTLFYGIPHPGDYYRLKEAWVIKRVEDAVARGLGANPTGAGSNWFIEHWTETKYSQSVNDRVIVDKTESGTRVPRSGTNPYGVVPIVYIPHIRVGTFFGINTFDHLHGLIKEINLRYADFGDAVNDDSHTNLAMRNVSGTPEVGEIGNGLLVVDLGSSRNITGNEPEPDLFEVSKSNKASNAMSMLSKDLYDQYRRDAAHPAVADGEDEGSQRSGLTIAMRFWPMTSHVSMERYFWTPALNRINEILLKMMAVKKKGDITPEHTRLRMKQIWAPMLPRDRETDVQEWAQRATHNIGSLQHLMSLTGDIEDPDEQMDEILDWVRKTKEIEAEVNAKYNNVVTEESPNEPPDGGGSNDTD